MTQDNKCKACEIDKNDEQVKQMPEHTCNKGSNIDREPKLKTNLSKPPEPPKETMKTAEEILIHKVGKLALSGLKWKSLNDRKQLIIEAMSDFAAQSVREYKEKLKNEVMSMRMNRHPVTAQVTIQVVVELIDSIDLTKSTH